MSTRMWLGRLVMCVLWLWAITYVPTDAADEKDLVRILLEGYEVRARPVLNSSHVVLVKFGITLVQIFDLDEVNQVLTVNVWLEQEWQDERLAWNPAEYGGQSVVRLPCDALWLPDIVLYNNAEDYKESSMRSKALVDYTGLVKWPPPVKLRSSCKVDVTYFPFDEQACSLKFGSWTYDGLQVDLINRTNGVDLTNYVENGEWHLIEVLVKRNVRYYSLFAEPYPDVTFTIVIRRRIMYYLINIIVPCLWLAILSSMTFLLPPDSGEKVTLGITVLLAFSVFMLLVAESMPKTSEFLPLIGIYLTITMSTTSLSILVTVCILKVHHVAPRQRKMPEWLRKFAFVTLARALCIRSVVSNFVEHEADDELAGLYGAVRLWAQLDERLRTTVAPFGSLSKLQPERPHRPAAPHAEVKDAAKPTEVGGTNGRPEPLPCHDLRRSAHTGSWTEKHKIISDEWKLLAIILDRLFFCAFFSMTIIATVGVLVIVPMTARR